MQVTIEIPDDVIDNAIESAGVRYWACELKWDREKREGYVVEAYDIPKKQQVRAPLDIARGLELMAKVAGGRHLESLLADNADAETGDVLVQLAALGELRYG